MCKRSEFELENNTKLIINDDCSVSLSSYVFDEELGGPDYDMIELSQKAAQKMAHILTEELG